MVQTILLGFVGMGGVFLGLTLLALCLFYMPRLLSRMGLDERDVESASPSGTPAPAPASPAPPPPAESGEEEAAPSEGSPSPVDPWRLAQGPLGEPGVAGWIRPAFRAAFRGGLDSAPAEAEIRVSGKPFRVSFIALDGSRARVSVNGREMALDLGDLPDVPVPYSAPLAPAPRRASPRLSPRPTPVAPKPASRPAPASRPSPAAHESEPGGMVAVRAPIPGTVKSIVVKQGEAVSRGQLVFLLEAMKMDNEIFSPSDGTVQEIRFQVKDAVRQGDILLLVKP